MQALENKKQPLKKQKEIVSKRGKGEESVYKLKLPVKKLKAKNRKNCLNEEYLHAGQTWNFTRKCEIQLNKLSRIILSLLPLYVKKYNDFLNNFFSKNLIFLAFTSISMLSSLT